MSDDVPDTVKAYLQKIGANGGKKSRRKLDPAQARRMVAVREAQRAFRHYQSSLFWSYPNDWKVTEAMVPQVIDQLCREGNKEAFLRAGKILRLWKGGKAYAARRV